MCLSVAVHRPDDVVAKGFHKGFEWNIVHNQMGYLCGYVKVEQGHPWHGKHYDEVDVDVHGGLTFAQKDEPCNEGGPDSGYWVGFDCAHAGDLPDPQYIVGEYRESRLRYAKETAEIYKSWPDGAAIRTQGYVEAACRSLCEQALAVVAQ